MVIVNWPFGNQVTDDNVFIAIFEFSTIDLVGEP